MVLGWEITVWERGVEIVRVSHPEEPGSPTGATGATASSGPEWLASGGTSWHLLSVVVPLWMPSRRIELTGEGSSTVVTENAPFAARGRERPPVPPPRVTEMSAVRC